MRLLFVMLPCLWVLSPGLATAQTGEGVVRTALQSGAHTVMLDTEWRGDEARTAQVSVRCGSQTRVVFEGPRVKASLAVNGDRVLVSIWRGGDGAFVRFFGATIQHDALGEFELWAEDSTFTGDAPFAAIATGQGQGFTVLWQAVAGSAARTQMGHLLGPNRFREPPRVVPIPWGLLALTPVPSGYLLAIRYDQGPGNSILNMVSLSQDGTPTNHPWWASQPGFISDVQFARSGERIHVFYRGGQGGERLLSRDVTAEGSWGRPPEHSATDHLSLSGTSAYAVRQAGSRLTPFVTTAPR